MVISEYEKTAQALSSLSNKDSVMKTIVNAALDTFLITGYVIGVVSVVPVLLAYTWAKDQWFIQA